MFTGEIMRYFMFVIVILVSMWSVTGEAAYSSMSFRIQTFGPHQYDYSSVWNPLTQEATLRVGLVPEKIDAALADKTVSFSTASKTEYVALDLPEIGEECSAVTHWQFEYQPGLPSYLMFLTLKGAGCKQVADMFDILQMRLRFYGVSLPQSEPVDVIVDISR